MLERYMPVFTTENALDYMINRKGSDCIQAKYWKNFNGGGFKLFKKGHIQNNDELTRCCVWCEVQVFLRDEKR